MRNLPWYRSGAPAIVFPSLFALLLGLCFTPFLSYSAMALYFLTIPCVCACLFLGGRAPAYLCTLLALGMFFSLLGAQGLLAGAVYLLPAIAAVHLVFIKRIPFPRSVLLVIGVIVLSQLAVYVAVQWKYERDAYRTLAGFAAQAIRAEGEVGDFFLILMNAYGILPISGSFEGSVGLTAIGGLTEAVREDLLATLQGYLVSYLTVFVPSMISGMSIYEGVLTVYAAARSEEAAQPKRHDLFQKEGEALSIRVPALRSWYLPKGWGWKIGVFAVGFIMVRLNQATLQLLGQVLLEVFTAVYTLQGIALINDLQARRDRKKWVRVLIPALLLIFAPAVLWILGCADQILDIRRLRQPKDTSKPLE